MDTPDENNKCELVSENKEFNQEVIRKALVNLLIVGELLLDLCPDLTCFK
ncbi:hypothetical protein HanXRQr2_Chr11g0505171 [Helianthus annuus]|uniref:Uncharacterized protein n=1 Tax=Helianthus annuus TaxID=4232 RepID=A0A9K3HR50_HELAN|nr:hypothetical protein HanXRQr2_Chr11g0505171 [Helianthus annuus]